MSFGWNAATHELSIAATVKQLRGDAELGAPGSDGETFDFFFTIGVHHYYARASRSIATAPAFEVREDIAGLPLVTSDTVIGAVSGSFDPSPNTVTVTVPAATLTSLTAGAKVTALSATAWQNETVPVDGRGLLLRNDDAAPAEACQITLP